MLNAMPLVKPDQVRTPWHEFWRRFRRQHMAMTAALFVILLIVVAILHAGSLPMTRKLF
ncbi:hypothetical protein ACULNC_22565 [Shigella flexneri]